ncbi:MAG: hypothetical protein U0835_18430 [Isosphaeraceae bacterium]
MSLRLRCRACQTAFVTDDDPRVTPAVCPKCGAKHTARAAPKPAPVAAPSRSPVPADEPEESVFVASGVPRRSRRGLFVGLTTVVLLAAAGVGVAVNWPAIRRWWNPVPPDPVEAVAASYLDAITKGDAEATERIGTIELPPGIRSFRSVRHRKSADTTLKGSFAPIAAFHARVAEKYTYDPSIDRYTPQNPLGPAAETLDALHDAKAKAEAENLDKKITSGDPEDLFDAAESMARSFTALAEGPLAPKKLIPTYQMLVDEANPPLPPPEKQLALDFAANRETWDALLKRPFGTLKADGPFVLDRAEVVAQVVDVLGSSGDPPKPMTLTLTRFRLEGIDTGWRVTAARRGNAPAPAASKPVTSPPPAVKTSPGERVGP